VRGKYVLTDKARGAYVANWWNVRVLTLWIRRHAINRRDGFLWGIRALRTWFRRVGNRALDSLAGVSIAGAFAVLAFTSVIVWVAANRVPDSDRAAIIGDALAAGTLILACFAGIVAAFAYRIAAQRPRLVVRIHVLEDPNGGADARTPLHQLALGTPNDGRRPVALRRRFVESVESITLSVRLQNVTPWSARNPALRLTLTDIRGISFESQQWVVQDQFGNSGFPRVLQWEGGADYSIHGSWTRALPPLSLTTAFVDPPGRTSDLVCEIVAEGFVDQQVITIVWDTSPITVAPNRGSLIGFVRCPSTTSGVVQIIAMSEAINQEPYSVTVSVRDPREPVWFAFPEISPGRYYLLAERPGRPNIWGACVVRHGKSSLREGTVELLPLDVGPNVVIDDIAIEHWDMRQRFVQPYPTFFQRADRCTAHDGPAGC